MWNGKSAFATAHSLLATMRYYSRIPLFLLIVGLLASLWTAARRVVVESAARTVELTVDLEQLRPVTLGTGVPLPEALEALKRAGVTSVAVVEKSLKELEDDSLAVVQHAPPGTGPAVTEVRIADPVLYRQVAEALRLKLRSADVTGAQNDGATGRRGDGEIRLSDSPRLSPGFAPLLSPSPGSVRIIGPGGAGLTIPAGWSAVQAVTVGLSARDVALVRSHGLEVVGRVSNFLAADEAAIAAVAHQLRAAGAHTVIFFGEEILGHRSRIKQTAAALDAEGLRYGSVEFGKQM